MNILNLPILEILISMVFIFALLSVLVYSLVEWYNHKTKARGKMLKDSIYQMLDDPLNANYGALLYLHPLVRGTVNYKNNRPPQYLDSTLFAEALIDIISRQWEDEGEEVGIVVNTDGSKEFDLKPDPAKPELHKLTDRELFQEGMARMSDSPFKELLESFCRKSKGRPELILLIRQWFDSQQDRVSGWYKTKQIPKNWVFAVLVTLFLNVDSFYLYQVVAENKGIRDGLVSMAMQADSTVLQKEAQEQIQWSLDHLGQTNLPLGWNKDIAPLSWWSKDQPTKPESKALQYHYRRNFKPQWYDYALYVFGLFFSMLMLSFGAPFWFDTLNKLINIRKAGKKPQAVHTPTPKTTNS